MFQHKSKTRHLRKNVINHTWKWSVMIQSPNVYQTKKMIYHLVICIPDQCTLKNWSGLSHYGIAKFQMELYNNISTVNHLNVHQIKDLKSKETDINHIWVQHPNVYRTWKMIHRLVTHMYSGPTNFDKMVVRSFT